MAFDSSGYIWAGTEGNGIYRISKSTTSVKNDFKEKIISFSLEQNYPNPFNPETNIKYQLPTLCMVNSKVYDVLGREITTLINKNQDAGNYSISFKPNSVSKNYSGGIFFYRLCAGDFIQVKKMMYLK